MTRSIATVFWIASVVVAAGCGGPAAGPTTPTTPKGEPAGPAVEAPQESSMTPEQRTAMQPLLLNYGSGWALESLERHYTIAVEETADAYVMTLTARGASGVTGVHRLGKQGAFTGDALQVPPGAELTPGQRADAEAVIRASKTVWLVLRDGRSEPLDVAQGFPAVTAATAATTTAATATATAGPTLETRLRSGRAVFYVREARDTTILALVVDLAERQITEVTWHDIPPNDAGLVPAGDIAAITEAMRLHGDFGVYGNVTPGLEILARDFGISLQKADGGKYRVGVYPRDGMGHELTFTVDLATKTISGMAAAHSVERPEPRE
jgi:hypothetical protein